jgi:hypothetical protein
MYCPEINEEDLSKDEGEALLVHLEECTQFGEQIDKLDTFCEKISLSMKKKGNHSQKTLLTVMYSRRWVFCTFYVQLFFDVLKLGEESDKKEENASKPKSMDEIIENTFSNLTKETPLPEKDKSNPLESKTTNKEKNEENAFKVCSSKTCMKRESKTEKFQVCGKCKAQGMFVSYCSRECQAAHWKQGHKEECGKLK